MAKTEPEEKAAVIRMTAMGDELDRKLWLLREFNYRWTSITVGASNAEWLIDAMPNHPTTQN